QEIRRGRYFFVDILRDGIELYHSRRLSLASPKALTPAQRLNIAERDFVYWYSSASAFWQGLAHFMAQGHLATSAFLLHQATERYYHAGLLVFTGYKPKTHNLQELAETLEAEAPALIGSMPRDAGEDQRLFKLLKDAYIEARYSKSYTITLDELTTLRESVRQ